MSLKKDILAAATFLTTGLVFMVVQMDPKPEVVVSQEIDCLVSSSQGKELPVQIIGIGDPRKP